MRNIKQTRKYLPMDQPQVFCKHFASMTALNHPGVPAALHSSLFFGLLSGALQTICLSFVLVPQGEAHGVAFLTGRGSMENKSVNPCLAHVTIHVSRRWKKAILPSQVHKTPWEGALIWKKQQARSGKKAGRHMRGPESQLDFWPTW